jgi:N-acetylmannosamine-6-phosphate 2-epimerase/N-acetylmannosamine kinase
MEEVDWYRSRLDLGSSRSRVCDASELKVCALVPSKLYSFCGCGQASANPSRIVIGGGVGLATGFLDRVRAEIAAIGPSAIPELHAATLGPRAGIVGVADLAITKQNQKSRRKTVF